ncbi:MAG TPA: STAS domain-containing protein [Micromonosporaceae bacterium]
MEFSIIAQDVDGARMLRLSGELDLAARDRLSEMAAAAIESSGAVTIDLADLSFIDSTGIGALVRARHLAEQKRIPYAVVGATGRVADVLALTGVADYLAASTNRYAAE